MARRRVLRYLLNPELKWPRSATRKDQRAPVLVDVDVGGLSPEPRHGHDLAAERHEPAGAPV